MIKQRDEAKTFYRCLIGFLSNSNLHAIVYALSTLSSLLLYDPLGRKLFNSDNIHQTFKLGVYLISECFSGDSAGDQSA
jgi:hypothetical protein